MSKKSKPRKQKEEELETIKIFYKKALVFIINKDFKQATNLLYNKMPSDLYDISLNILYNINDETFFDKELRELIIKVDNELCEESIENLDFEDNLDEFNNQF